MTETIPSPTILDRPVAAWLAHQRALGRGFSVEERVLDSLRRCLARLPGADLDQGGFDRWCETLRHLDANTRRARQMIGGYPDLGRVPEILSGVEAALDAPADHPLLGSRPTPAELRVLRLLDGDRSFAEIAADLFLSRDTVKSHARRLYRRLGERTREGAVAAARERGLI